MPCYSTCLLTILVILFQPAGWGNAETYILVNLGPYPSAEVAGRAEAKRIAGLLRADTTSVALCYSPGAPNAFEATYAARSLGHLAKLLGAE